MAEITYVHAVINATVKNATAAMLLLCVVRMFCVPLQETVFQAQAAQLAAAVPELFAPGCSIRLATENGRSLLAKAGFTASRYERCAGTWPC